MTNRGTIALDFDGVLHSYTSGWQGIVPTDPPVLGSREACDALTAQGWRVVVFTCRALTHEGRAAVHRWLDAHRIRVDEVTAIKPHAVIYVDDRAHRFTGSWLEVVELAKDPPRPWTAPEARHEPAPAAVNATCALCGVGVYDVMPTGVYLACGHPIPGAEVIT